MFEKYEKDGKLTSTEIVKYNRFDKEMARITQILTKDYLQYTSAAGNAVPGEVSTFSLFNLTSTATSRIRIQPDLTSNNQGSGAEVDCRAHLTENPAATSK